jgi:hypothetical protein
MLYFLYIYNKSFYFVTNLTVLRPVSFQTPYATKNITYIQTETRTFNFVPPSK